MRMWQSVKICLKVNQNKRPGAIQNKGTVNKQDFGIDKRALFEL